MITNTYLILKQTLLSPIHAVELGSAVVPAVLGVPLRTRPTSDGSPFGDPIGGSCPIGETPTGATETIALPIFTASLWQRQLTRIIALLVFLWITGVLPTPAMWAEGNQSDTNANRIIQYRGPMPLLRKELWGRDVELKFELYRSPNGGSPFWKESRRVRVREDGWVNVDLGQVEALPDEAFTSPFRFLSIWNDRYEFVPRKQVASVVYVASAYETGMTNGSYVKPVSPAPKAVGAQASDQDNRLDTLIECGAFSMETNPRVPATWLEAAATATRLSAHLPTFEEWYGAYEGKAGKKLSDMAGHYEWVVPWVYEPAIHARMHELYRGRTMACYYNELSPLNSYPFRLVRRAQPDK